MAIQVQLQSKIMNLIEAIILENGGKVALPKYDSPEIAWQGYYVDWKGIFSAFISQMRIQNKCMVDVSHLKKG